MFSPFIFKVIFFFLNCSSIYLFIYLSLAVLGLRFCARAFFGCGERGPLFIAVAGLSLSRPLLLRSTGSRRAGSAAVAHGPSRSAACGILPDQGSNPRPLHWQADSQPLRHQGSPIFKVIIDRYELIALFLIVIWLFMLFFPFPFFLSCSVPF